MQNSRFVQDKTLGLRPDFLSPLEDRALFFSRTCSRIGGGRQKFWDDTAKPIFLSVLNLVSQCLGHD